MFFAEACSNCRLRSDDCYEDVSSTIGSSPQKATPEVKVAVAAAAAAAAAAAGAAVACCC